MAVSRDTVSIALLLCVIVALIALVAVKWTQRKENFIEHFYEDKEYSLRQAVMSTFDDLIKRKATPKEIEKYSTEHNSVEQVIEAIKKDFHLEQYAENVAEEESPSFQIVEEFPDNQEKEAFIKFERQQIEKLLSELKGYVSYLENKLE